MSNTHDALSQMQYIAGSTQKGVSALYICDFAPVCDEPAIYIITNNCFVIISQIQRYGFTVVE